MVSDASGPVTIDAAGNTLTIRYTVQQGGLKVASRITLAPAGRSGENRTAIAKWGLTAATMAETILKQKRCAGLAVRPVRRPRPARVLLAGWVRLMSRRGGSQPSARWACSRRHRYG